MFSDPILQNASGHPRLQMRRSWRFTIRSFNVRPATSSSKALSMSSSTCIGFTRTSWTVFVKSYTRKSLGVHSLQILPILPHMRWPRDSSEFGAAVSAGEAYRWCGGWRPFCVCSDEFEIPWIMSKIQCGLLAEIGKSINHLDISWCKVDVPWLLCFYLEGFPFIGTDPSARLERPPLIGHS